jgi:membrane associated rhomboid family serine protease
MFLALPLYDDAPRATTPIANYALVGACVAVFLWQQALPGPAGERAVYEYGMVPAVLFGQAHLAPPLHSALPPWTTIFTSMFMHGGFLHIAGNMLYLWIFGKGVELALGPARYLLFYLLCGVAAALTQALVNPASDVPMIGASGAIAGVLGAYLVLHPRGNVVTLVWIVIIVRLIALPAALLLGIWFLLQLTSALSSAGEPGVAVWAHVGGFLTGMALVVPFRRRGVRLFHPARSTAFSLAPRRRQRGPWG